MVKRQLRRVLDVGDDELAVALLACLFFFCLLCGYFILRPLREEMGLAGGVRNLPWLFLGTLVTTLLVTPLFGACVNRFPRRGFIAVTYRFFALNILVFFVLLNLRPDAANVQLGRVFYVWVSVFNMFIVSLFWAFLADGCDLRRSKRLFGLIAVGGTVGALAGAGITNLLVAPLGRINLLLISVVFLEAAVWCMKALDRRFEPWRREREAAGGSGAAVEWRVPGASSIFNGILLTMRSPYLLGISAFLALYSLSATFVYFEQANIVAEVVESREGRAALFAQIDLWVQGITLLVQLLLAGRMITRLGVGRSLMMLPALCALGFLALGLAPVLPVLVVFQVLRKAANYALVRPARETLFTIVSREEKYKAKSFIDTFVYRGGDALGAAFFDLLTRAGLGLAGIAFTAIPFALVWGVVGSYLGAQQVRRANAAQAAPSAPVATPRPEASGAV